MIDQLGDLLRDGHHGQLEHFMMAGREQHRPVRVRRDRGGVPERDKLDGIGLPGGQN